MMAPHALPTPRRERWQPLRAGLVDLFYYDAEEFWFRDGRLLLRGNNGTGKSKVLALTLPFLLDAELSAHRVEPDGDPKKKMEWNLLLDGEHPHPERLGYCWLEFGRVDPDGAAHFTTLGCGMKAVAGRGVARHWFFVTDQRIGAAADGAGLRLLDSTGAAIGRDRLADALDGHGMVYDSARSYRRAVDEALFGLGEQRYAALVDLLVQLRQPQLSKRPDERALSRALTEALPPMDQAVVADVAEAFRSLDEEKENLQAMTEAHRAASGFLGHYRRYARAAARRKARAPRQQNSKYEAQRAELSAAEQARAAAQRAIDEGERRLGELERDQARLRAQDAALRESPEMRSAQALDAAADRARVAQEAESRARGDLGQAEEQSRRAVARVTAAAARLDGAGHRLEVAARGAREGADRARIGREHAETVAEPVDSWRTDAEAQTPLFAVDELRHAAARLADRRVRSVALIEKLSEEYRGADSAAGLAERRLDEADADLAIQAEQHTEAQCELDDAGSRHIAAARGFFDEPGELAVADLEGALDLLAEWVGTLDGPSPLRTAVDAAAEVTRAAHAAEQAALDAARADARQRRDDAKRELAELEAGGQLPPAAPYTRDAAVRADLAGAPLWRLVDFHDGVEPPRRARIEAALEAAGLLDAWITPDGRALSADTHDVLLVPGDPLDGPSLAQVLHPAPDHGDPRAAAVPATTIARLLAGIGLLAAEQQDSDTEAVATWVSDDGRFRNGPARGAWAKPAAQYLGEGARQEARRARIAQLGELLASISGELAALDARERALDERRRALASHLADDCPPEDELRAAHARVSAAADQLRRLTERRARLADAAARDRAAADAAKDELRRNADELDLPAEPEALHLIRDGLGAYREALAALWPAIDELAAARRATAEERAAHEDATEYAARMAQRVEQAAADSAEAAARHETLAATVGAAVSELQRRLAEVADAQRDNHRTQREVRGALDDAREARGEAVGRHRQLKTDLEETVRERQEAVDALRRFADTGLLAVALPDLETPDPAQPWAPDPAVRLARTIEHDLEDTDDSDAAWDRVQKRVAEELKDLAEALARHGHSAGAEMLEDGIVVSVVFQGRPRTVPGLVAALETDIADRRRLLSEREQEILENHLITEVAGTLAELIAAADRQVLAMNTELESRPTSTGMRLRLLWRPARGAPAGLAAARQRLLRQSADAWSAADRSAVGEFLQAQIDQARTEDPTGTWLEHLGRALDYRTWHEFAIERYQHGRWQPATGPASGGERVLAVSVPLFAAASSHYASAASSHCPRLVALDEAFAGVDDDARAKCLGLLAAFDLDVVMTSEREWGCYPHVPGLAIAQLSRVDEVAAVLVTRWEWDGRRRLPGADPGDLLSAASLRAVSVSARDGDAVADPLFP
jgi:uncharacterized protein (TIGR02680 family)